MTSPVFDGKAHQKKLLEELKVKIAFSKITPTLGIIQVGDDPASNTYIAHKQKAAKTIGAKVLLKKFPEKTPQKDIVGQIEKWNKERGVHGMIVQLPLPPQLKEEEIIKKVNPKKDVDGFHPQSPYTPPTAAAVLYVLEQARVSIPGTQIVVIGRGKTAGEPIARTLLLKGARITIVHSKTKNAKGLIKSANVLISAVGRKGFQLTGEDIKEGAVVVGVGTRKDKNGKLVGDLDEESIKKVVSFYTPTPGGVGPLTVTMLMKNLVTDR